MFFFSIRHSFSTPDRHDWSGKTVFCSRCTTFYCFSVLADDHMDLCRTVTLVHQSLWFAVLHQENSDQTSHSLSRLHWSLFIPVLHHEQICLPPTNVFLRREETQMLIASFTFLPPTAIVTQTAYCLGFNLYSCTKYFGVWTSFVTLCSAYFFRSALSDTADQSSQ